MKNRAARATTPERFWKKVDRSGDCWLWTACCYSTGYGQFFVEGRHQLAHRLSYEWTFGSVPEGECVLHHCDNRRCVRPEHLFLGSRTDNAADKVAKGRHRGYQSPKARGARNHSAKLTDSQVLEIRRRYGIQEASSIQLAEEYGVSDVAVRNILHRRTWRHLPVSDEESIERARRASPGARGPLNPNAKLTPSLAKEIRASYAMGGISTRALAAEDNLGPSTIKRVIRHETYF